MLKKKKSHKINLFNSEEKEDKNPKVKNVIIRQVGDV